jgi:hypothetical protein
MKRTLVALDVPSDADEIVRRHKWWSITKVAPNPCVVLSFGGGHSARHSGVTLDQAYRSAYVDIALGEFLDRKSDPRLTIEHRGFGTEIHVELRLEHEVFFTTWHDSARPSRHSHEQLAVAVANLYAATDRQKRIVDAVTKRISQK